MEIKYFWVKSYYLDDNDSEIDFEAILRISQNGSIFTIKATEIKHSTVGLSSVGCFPIIDEMQEDLIDYLMNKLGYEMSIDWAGEITKEDYEELTRK